MPAGADGDLLEKTLFDQGLGEERFRQAAMNCYYPAAAHFRGLLDRGCKVALGFSLAFVEQAKRWDPALLDAYRKLVRHSNVELVNAEASYSRAVLWDIRLFVDRVKMAGTRLQEVFGVRPLIVDTSGVMMSDAVYHALDAVGFRAALTDGGHWLTNWREPTQICHHEGGRMKILTRHNQLSEDVALRFSDTSWPAWPLMADQYATWLAGNRGKVVVLGWDIDTFGIKHSPESGIFQFLDALPDAVRRLGLEFATPSDVLARHGSSSFDLPNTEFAPSRIGSTAPGQFAGASANGILFQLMIQAHQKAVLTGRPELIEFALRLSQGECVAPGVHAGTVLHSEGSAAEIQEVFRNFIRAMDDHLDRAAKRPLQAQESVTEKALGRRGRKSKKVTRVAEETLALSS